MIGTPQKPEKQIPNPIASHMPEPPAKLLRRLAVHMDKVQYAVVSNTFESFSENSLLKDSVELSLLRLGDMARRLNHFYPNVTQKSPHIPWFFLSSLAGRLVMDYFNVDAKELWETANHPAITELEEPIWQLILDLEKQYNNEPDKESLGAHPSC